ncbi:MAG: class I SAM-dependent methyltransferase [Cellulosilyticaceae bacterium]
MSKDVVREYYDSRAEGELMRLARPYNNIEFQTTMYVIEKYFQKESKMLEIGSGPGRYSLPLLEKGHKVSLLDISQNELDIAKRRITEKGYEADGYYCQSAMDLSRFEDESFDAVLVMGPMYHLHGEENRVHVLKEVKRILKPKGKALIAYINIWGVLKASLYECPDSFADDQHFYEYEQGSLELSEEVAFTKAYFTTPPIALQEIEKSGLSLVSYAGAESFMGGLMIETSNLANYMPDTYKLYVKKACEYCELPQYRDATEHTHFIVEK